MPITNTSSHYTIQTGADIRDAIDQIRLYQGRFEEDRLPISEIRLVLPEGIFMLQFDGETEHYTETNVENFTRRLAVRAEGVRIFKDADPTVMPDAISLDEFLEEFAVKREDT